MRYIRLITYILFFTPVAFSQTSYTLEQCEQEFLSKNLLLLAENYGIEASKAAVIQAKIWEQPYISGELNLLRPDNNSLFNIGNSGQKTLAVDQLIYLGGKKKKEVEFAKSNVELAELEYAQLLGNLKYELRKSFYEIYFSQLKTSMLSEQLSRLDTLISAYTIQAKKGNVPYKDLVRLQTLSLSLKNEFFDIQKSVVVHQESLKLLLRSTANIVASVPTELEIKKLEYGVKYNESYLQKSALEKNPEYLMAEKLIENSTLMLQWQKALATPDITVGANYDQRGGAFNNQVNLTFGIPLPLWNKNRGNINRAEAEINQNKIYQDFKKDELLMKVSAAINTLKYQQQQYAETMQVFPDFESVYEGVLRNFQSKNISIIEFTDFMESYSQSALFLNEIKKQTFLSGEFLNYLTNENVF